MQINEFYKHFCEELRQNRSLFPYYKLTDGSLSQQNFRKAYFIQRLEYINCHIKTEKNPVIWDCGCGYGTTGLFFAMNKQPVMGTTLEYYSNEWQKRCDFWNKFGNTTLFSYQYANLFDQKIEEESFDYIILQDTLHHIEPVEEGLKIFNRALKKGGKLILIEENGACLLKRFMLYRQRGNKRVVSVYDDVLGKEILMGNENIRSEQQWLKLFNNNGFSLVEDSLKYIRFFPAFYFKENNLNEIIEKEQNIWKNNRFLREKFFFGLNMTFKKESF